MARRSRRATGPNPRPLDAGTAARQLWTFVALMITAGAVVLTITTVRSGLSGLVGPEPTLFWIFATLLTLAETRPIKWLRRHEGGEVTASWTFAFALLFSAPVAGTLLALAFASLLGDFVHRKPVVRTLFNAAQVSLSLAAGAALLEVFHQRGTLTAQVAPQPAWLGAVVVTAATVFILNGVFTSSVLALHQNLPVWPMVRNGVSLNLSTDGMLLALAPIFVVVAERSVLFLPLLVVTAWAVYQSAQLALARQHEATHDLLTELPNRRLFNAQATSALLEAEHRGQLLAIVMLDLDRFKEINDRLGHHVGDLTLQEVARRLQSSKRNCDLVARIGGDEFAMVVTGMHSAELAEAVARRVQAALIDPCPIQGVPVAVGGSFGIALYPDHGADVNTLMEHADFAMYSAKQSGTRIAVYNPTRDRRGRGRLSLLAELPRAIERNELTLHYQPKIDFRTGGVVGCEALVRWQHPRLGLVAPDQFMPLAEHTELMAPLTEHILRMALEQCAEWRRQGRGMRIAVNGSTRNLHDLRFPEVVASLLAESGLDSSCLELEITENTVTADPLRSTAVLGSLRAMGIRIAIDDFGTGYSSLAHLRELPVDSVKIDRSFVAGVMTSKDDAVIVQSIIDLARNLGLETVAEGVESPDCWEYLDELGCDIAQGFLISRPLDPVGFAAWLDGYGRVTTAIA